MAAVGRHQLDRDVGELMETLEQRLKKILGEQAFMLAMIATENDGLRQTVEQLRTEVAQLKGQGGPASSSR
jgi:hypothetical protein